MRSEAYHSKSSCEFSVHDDMRDGFADIHYRLEEQNYPHAADFNTTLRLRV